MTVKHRVKLIKMCKKKKNVDGLYDSNNGIFRSDDHVRTRDEG